MSSCFLCDCSYNFYLPSDVYYLTVPRGDNTSTTVRRYKKVLPIIIGSSGLDRDDQQHINNRKQNYVSYGVKKIEFCFSFPSVISSSSVFPDYIVIFKVPFRNPIVNYESRLLDEFMLYSEPENVLGYKMLPSIARINYSGVYGTNKIDINKSFIVGPNDYLGVFYMFSLPPSGRNKGIDASAKVWFDIA